MDKKIFIYVGGSCKNNLGGWAVVYRVEGEGTLKTVSGKFSGNVTSNRMELLAVIKGLEIADSLGLTPIILSDSDYIVKTINKNWYNVWKANKKHYANKDLWDKLMALFRKTNAKIFHLGKVGKKSSYAHKIAHLLARVF